MKEKKDKSSKFWIEADSAPQLSLHSAAATGNVGLVKYALINGQPQNSALHGVLPIHAACSNGNEAIVRMLIENGADVNAPRLPRRYSNDKRHGVVLSVGTSGSTPLHFAAANGHLGIIELLLSCGARPDLTEKRGLTPEDVALEFGHQDVAKVLRNWDRRAAAEALSATDHASRRPSIDGRALPPPDLRPVSSSSNLRRSSDASRSAKSSIKQLKGARRHKSSTSLKSQGSVSPEPTTYSSLTHLPNTSHHSLHRRDSRKGLPSVLEKAASSTNSIKQALGMSSSGSTASLNRPPPLHLVESTSEAFAPEFMRRESGSSTRSALKAVFARGRRSSTSSMASAPFSPDSGMGLTPFSTIEPDSAQASRTQPTSPSADEFGDVGSPQESILETPISSPEMNIGVPAPSLDGKNLGPSENSYRPRKSSILSTRHAINARDLPLFDSSLTDTPSPEVHIPPAEIEDEHKDEATDQVPLEISSPRRSPVLQPQRLRADSAGSASSAASRYSSHPSVGAPSHSPTNVDGSLKLPVPENQTRARRSASTSTDPDLRHLVLSMNRDGSQSDIHSSSPVSSTWSQAALSFEPDSLNTPATSIIASGKGSLRDPPISPRRFSSGQVITKFMADALVKEAQEQLMSYDAEKSEHQATLAEQLAAYSDTLQLQRAVAKQERSQQSYTWEKLERDGNRTPLNAAEKAPSHATSSHRYKASTSFQQGFLDNRRHPPPKLRQQLPKSETKSASSSSMSSRIQERNVTPPGQTRHQYRILESNSLAIPVANTIGRLSPTSTVDDPVRGSASSTASSETVPLELPRVGRGARQRTSQVVVEPIELDTPIASTRGKEPPFGIASLNQSSRPKTKFAQGLQSLKDKLL